MQVELTTAKESLTNILTSKDLKATVYATHHFCFLIKPIGTNMLNKTQLNCLNNAVAGDGGEKRA